MQTGSAAPAQRRRLLRALAGGALGCAVPAAAAQLLGKTPHELPAGQSIYDLRGQVTVDGAAATPETLISANATIATGARAQLIFVVGKDAFLLRENSTLALAGSKAVVQTLRLLTGALLSVFGKGEHQLVVPTATVGIRGTGIYAEAQAELCYLCTCYGIVDINATGTAQSERIEAKHHDDPRYIASSGDARIRSAPMINHTDEELLLIETLVGRVPPFALIDDGYGRSRRY